MTAERELNRTLGLLQRTPGISVELWYGVTCSDGGLCTLQALEARLTQSIGRAALTELPCIDLCIVFCKDHLILARVVSSIKTDG